MINSREETTRLRAIHLQHANHDDVIFGLDASSYLAV